MANTLTNLLPDVYAALDVVSRELTGLVNAAQRDSSADSVGYSQTVRIPVTPSNTTSSITAAMSLPSAADQTISNVTLSFSKQKFSAFSWSAEEEKAINRPNGGYLTMKQDQIAQAIRALVNEMETDIATAGYKGASRAYGTAGTAPFGTAGDYSDASQVRKILDDNGAPASDRSLVLNTAAGANIRGKQAQVYMYGDASLLRQGVLLDTAGFAVRESAQIQSVTKGTGTSYLVNNVAGYSVGATTIAADTGSGTILAGDIVTFNGDTNKYVVATALSAGSFTIAAPGLRAALADNTAITVGNNFAGNLAFSRNAILLATRTPAVPGEGDLATDRQIVTDPRTGLSFEFAVYPGFRMNTYHVAAVWGVSVIKPEHVAILLG